MKAPSFFILFAALSLLPLAAATFDFAVTGGSSGNNSTGAGGNVTVADATVATTAATIDGIQLTLNATSTAGTPTIGANAQGFGVSTAGENHASGTRIQANMGETLRLSFDTAVTLDSMRFGNFENGEVLVLSHVAGTGSNPFTSESSLTITGNGNQGPSTDVLLANNPIVSGGITRIEPGTVIEISMSGAGQDVLLNELTVSPTVNTSVIESIPMPNIAQNSNSGSNPGSTTVASRNAKGQSFSLPASASVSGFVFECAKVNATGSFKIELHRAMDDQPWLLDPVISFTADLPDGLAAGELFRISLPAALELHRGSYLVSLEGVDSTSFSLTFSNDVLFASGAGVRNNSNDGWRTLVNPEADLVFAVLGTLETPESAPTDKPNILFILADDFGWTDPQCGPSGPNVINGENHGSDFYQTPNLARLAEEGLSFTHSFVQPNCAPTRAALISGQYANRSGNGVYAVDSLNRGGRNTTYVGPNQNEDIPVDHVVWSEALQSAGYVTAHFGKYHLANHETGLASMPENRGFDFNFGGNKHGNPGAYFARNGAWHSNIGPGLAAFAAPYTQAYVDKHLKGPAANPINKRALNYRAFFPNAAINNPDILVGGEKHLSDAVGDATTAFIRDHRKGNLANRPFFMQVHFYAVHYPIQPRPDLAQKYRNVPKGAHHTNASYAALVEGMDQNIGRILDALDDPNGDGDNSDSIAASTLVIFLSDNGGYVGPTDNTPLRHHKGSFWNGGLRVPLIARRPGIVPAAQQSNTLVHAVDFYPTLMEHAGITLPAGINFDGESFATHMTDPAKIERIRKPIHYHFPGYLDMRARPVEVAISRIDGEDYKLIYNYDTEYTGNPSSAKDIQEGLKTTSQPWELYNLTRDISETNNLLASEDSNQLLYANISGTLAAGMHAWLNQGGEDWAVDKLKVRRTGETVDYPAAAIPEISVGYDRTFSITDTAVQRDGADIRLTWDSEAGFYYEILASNSLKGPWAVIGNAVKSKADTSTRMFNDPLANTEDRRFYRVRLVPTP